MATAWTEIATFKLPETDFRAPWIAVPDDLGDATHLQIKADGLWTPLGGSYAIFGPDGVSGLPVKDEGLVVVNCPVFALIGRIGGSSANAASQSASTPLSPNNESKPFPVGTLCTIAMPTSGAFGTLFLSFNTLLRPIQINWLNVTISGVKLPPPAPPQ